MIRKDLIEEFITYVNKNDYSLNNKIEYSIFETNDFFIKHQNTTLIEYAAFFRSTQIFKYLYKNGVEFTPSLWLYGIHSNNPKKIHFLKKMKLNHQMNRLHMNNVSNNQSNAIIMMLQILFNLITFFPSVTSIGNNTFEEYSSLTQISIPSSVKSIVNNAYSGCSSLTQISITLKKNA